MYLFTRIIVAGILLLSAFRVLAEDPPEERWNAYGQFTWMWQQKEPFPAAYTNQVQHKHFPSACRSFLAFPREADSYGAPVPGSLW